MSDNQSPLSSPLDNLDALTLATEAAAQDLVSQAAAEMGKVEEKTEETEVQEVKPAQVPILPKLSVGVTEHPISDADAAKFVGGSGDYAMPLSPLDDLSDLAVKADPLPQPIISEPSAAPNVPLPPVTVEEKTDVIRPIETKDLEQKAKEMLNDFGSAPPPPKKKSSAITKMALVAVLMVLMGAGGFVGVNLLTTNKSTENRSDAYNPCGEGYYVCNVGCCQTGGSGRKNLAGTVTWDANTPLKDLTPAQKAAVTQGLKDHGLEISSNGTIILTTNTKLDEWLDNNENGKLVYNYCYSGGELISSKCSIVAGGYLYIGGSRAGSACEPDLTKGGDWCQVIGGESKLCEDLDLIRCKCGNGVGVIGSEGQSCDGLCGGTNNVCESCDEGDDDDAPSDDDDDDTPTFACTGITPSVAVANITLGSPVSFTCAGSGGAVSAEFQYSIDEGTPVTIPTDSSNKLKSGEVTFTRTGDYKVACRVCQSDGTTCSDWGIAQ